KHNNPCGVALAATAAAAFEAARRTDPTSAFGGILAFNREVDAPAATAATSLFLECLIAPSVAAAARPILAAKLALRVLEAGAPASGDGGRRDLRSISGGLLVQDRDGADTDLSRARVVTRRAPGAAEQKALDLAW